MNNPLELTSDARHLREAPPNRVLIVGARRQSRRLVRSFKRGPWANHSLVGFIDAGHGANHGRRRQVAIHPRFELVPVLGGLDRIDEFVDRAKATDVVVAVSPKSAPRLRLRMARLVNSDVAVHWVIDDGTNVATPMGELAIEAVSSPISWSRLASRIAKRGLDIFGAAARRHQDFVDGSAVRMRRRDRSHEDGDCRRRCQQFFRDHVPPSLQNIGRPDKGPKGGTCNKFNHF